MTTVTDPDKGTVTKVTDPVGQEVNSQYDALRRLTKTSTMLNSQEVKTENTYQAQTGYLASTTHNTDNSGGSVTYNFAYDFTEWRNPFTFSGLAYNMGKILQFIGSMSEFDIDLTVIMHGVE